MTGHASLDLAVEALRHGAADFLSKPIKLGELDAVIEKCMRLHQLRAANSQLRRTIGRIQAASSAQLTGPSQAMARIRQQIHDVLLAKCRTILITGETGTGKEVVARAIHFGESGAEDRPFIAISCPALPETLVESELFGHVKGTFTGASFSRPGCFELASGGTLFLDEIGDLSPVAQAKMLRVLETRAVRRLGDSHERPVDLRIVGATNADLHAQIKAGQFRADLFYRLQLFPIHIPPLRERPEDIIPLAMHFLQEFAQHYGKRDRPPGLGPPEVLGWNEGRVIMAAGSTRMGHHTRRSRAGSRK